MAADRQENTFDPREQLRQELLFHANNSANRSLEYWARATENRLQGDELAAQNCQFLANLSFNDSLFEAYEAGEVISANKERRDMEDPVFVGLMGLARNFMDRAVVETTHAQTLLSGDEKFEDEAHQAYSDKEQAIRHAYAAGVWVGNGQRSGVRPTFTVLPE